MAAQNQPAFSLRDGAIKLTCWANKGDKDKTILKASALMQEAYAKIRELRSESVEAVAS